MLQLVSILTQSYKEKYCGCDSLRDKMRERERDRKR